MLPHLPVLLLAFSVLARSPGTSACSVRIVGPAHVIYEHTTDSVPYVDPGARCAGCAATVPGKATGRWARGALDWRLPGKYVRVFSCGTSATAQRIIEVRDTQPPDLQLVGKQHVTVPHSDDVDAAGGGDGDYEDQGATCEDDVDGELSHTVIVSGGVVRTNMPGEYHIHYECQDISGNSAHVTRHVTVLPPSRRAKVAKTALVPQNTKKSSVHGLRGAQQRHMHQAAEHNIDDDALNLYGYGYGEGYSFSRYDDAYKYYGYGFD